MGQRKKRSDQKVYHFTYKTICSVTRRYYLGMHSTDDVDDGYLGSGLILNRSVKKHSEERHICEVLKFYDDRKALCMGEKELITEEILIDPLCMNLCLGGRGGNAFQKGHKVTDETRKKIGNAHRGKKLSEEQKKMISEVHKGMTPWNKGSTKESDERVAQGAKRSSEVKKGRSKETHAYIARHAELLRGRTKENHPSVARMAEKRRVPWSEARRQAYNRSIDMMGL